MISSFIQYIKHPSARFILKVLILYILWDYVLVNWLNHTSVAKLVSQFTLIASEQLLSLWGYQASVNNTTMHIDQQPLVYMGNACNGMDFMGLFACFVIAYPSKIRAKWWFLPLGLCAIFGLNIIRIALLSINALYWEASFAFNHKHTFVVLVYGIMFLMWISWINKYGRLEKA